MRSILTFIRFLFIGFYLSLPFTLMTLALTELAPEKVGLVCFVACVGGLSLFVLSGSYYLRQELKAQTFNPPKAWFLSLGINKSIKNHKWYICPGIESKLWLFRAPFQPACIILSKGFVLRADQEGLNPELFKKIDFYSKAPELCLETGLICFFRACLKPFGLGVLTRLDLLNSLGVTSFPKAITEKGAILIKDSKKPKDFLIAFFFSPLLLGIFRLTKTGYTPGLESLVGKR